MNGLTDSLMEIEKDESALSYNGFLERLRRPGSRDLVDCIRRFINSVLGPRGDGSPPDPEAQAEEADLPFNGTNRLPEYTKGFLLQMEQLMETHVAWRYASEDTQMKAKNGLEKYVMTKLYTVAFNDEGLYDHPEDEEDGRQLARRVGQAGGQRRCPRPPARQ